ncbi:U32 family peptidase [Mariniblastus fucicola]|nr:U32 family peptidase [Mariniblastus fucicola]
MPRKPELMSPAGGWPQLHAAIEAGADAVYFGLNHFSARAKVGFDLAELPEVMRTLHRRSVKGFVTFNTLVFDHEIDAAKNAIEEIAAANTDAIIVQDVGIAKLARQIAPDLAIHGSTQMSVTSAQGVELAASLGCSRVVLGRELSLADMRKIASQTDVELECFVHGALCVSYSGQCFSSEAWGGRSANRGKCAQACRLSYDLIVDGEKRDLGPHRYLLSPGDLYAIEQIPELVEIGIACLKIEGRYKDESYVAATTRAYREAIDLAMMQLPNEDAAEEKKDLEQIYSRGLGAHFMSGVNHQNVVIGRAPRHRGVLVGKVTAVDFRSVDVEFEHEIGLGDGLVFDAADWRSPDEPEEGGSVYGVKSVREKVVRLEFEHGKLQFDRIRVGDLVWRTHQAAVIKSLKPMTKASKPVFTRPIDFVVTAKVGQPLKITVQHESGLNAVFESETPLEAAAKRALDDETLTEKLGRLGGTAFHLGEIERTESEAVFVPTSMLNDARRQLVEALMEKLAEHKPGEDLNPVSTSSPSVADSSLPTSSGSPAAEQNNDPPKLHLLVRTAEQLDAAIRVRPDSITLDYLELYGLRPSVEKIRAANIVARVASPRILKPSEQNIIRFLTSLECEILVRSGGLLHDLLQTEIDRDLLIGDFSLNAANALAVETYQQMGLSRITPTYDLNAQQVSELAEQVDPRGIEVIAFSHLPVFHTEHCVFCRFLSDGTDNTNCGHPCETHRIAVRDAQGREHPVMADVGCRNTVFGAEAQTDPQSIASWQEAGIANFRLEFVYQTPEQIVAIADAFRSHLDGMTMAHDLATVLEANSPQQTTRGSLFVPQDFKSLVQLR